MWWLDNDAALLLNSEQSCTVPLHYSELEKFCKRCGYEHCRTNSQTCSLSVSSCPHLVLPTAFRIDSTASVTETLPLWYAVSGRERVRHTLKGILAQQGRWSLLLCAPHSNWIWDLFVLFCIHLQIGAQDILFHLCDILLAIHGDLSFFNVFRDCVMINQTDIPPWPYDTPGACFLKFEFPNFTSRETVITSWVMLPASEGDACFRESLRRWVFFFFLGGTSFLFPWALSGLVTIASRPRVNVQGPHIQEWG